MTHYCSSLMIHRLVCITLCMQNSRITSSLGYDICIGVALVKTWRVVYIFKYPKPGKSVSFIIIICMHYNAISNSMFICTQPPKDWQLLLAVGVMVLVETCITFPLVILAILDGDFFSSIDKENAPRRNVSLQKQQLIILFHLIINIITLLTTLLINITCS